MSTDTAPAARPRWHWSYIDDIGWISPEEAATIDPWADNPTEVESSTTEAEPPTTPDEMPPDSPGTAGFDLWADSA